MSDDPAPEDVLPEELLTPDQRATTGASSSSPPEPDDTADAPEPAGTDDTTPQERLRVDDHRDLITRQRIEDILRAREDARDALAEVEMLEAQAGGGGARQTADKHLYGQLWALATQLETLLRETELGREYWTGAGVGTFALPQPDADHHSDYRVDAPDRLVEREDTTCEGRRCDLCADGQRSSPPALTIGGVRDFVALGGAIEVSWRESSAGQSPRLTSRRTERVTPREVAPPRGLSRQLFRALDEFCEEIGLGLDVDEGDQSGFTLADIRE